MLIAERGGAAAKVRRRVDGRVRDQLLRGGLGAGGRFRLRRLGQHHQLRAAGQHLRPLRQVLPVPAAPRWPAAAGSIRAAAHGPGPRHATGDGLQRHRALPCGPIPGAVADDELLPPPPPPQAPRPPRPVIDMAASS
jgi:hypothetical protein